MSLSRLHSSTFFSGLFSGSSCLFGSRLLGGLFSSSRFLGGRLLLGNSSSFFSLFVAVLFGSGSGGSVLFGVLL